ncbi:MAG: helix-turn-helix domain-containing protein [Deltaproteobacteria bacterium]|nr:helix-turn-helix domain-containing protein [Deltaproteobacteria bacterium]
MSIEQLALATKIPRASLELLEDDRYDGLPGPVFVKGFLRCAARAVGVDPQVVLDLLYERERAALAARRGSRPVSGPAATAAAASPKMPSRPGRRGATGRARGRALPTRAPRLRAPASPDAPGLVARLRGRMPSPAVFLWLVVAAFVAMVVLAAFNLVGGGHPGQS